MRHEVRGARLAGVAAALAGLCVSPRTASAQMSALPPEQRVSAWDDSQVSLGASANGSFFDNSYVISGADQERLDLGLSFWLRYRFHRMFQARLSWDFAMELTDSDRTTTAQELEVSDPVLSLWFDGIPSVAGVRFGLAATLSVPVSPVSRAATMILAPGLLAQAHWEARAFGGTFHAIGRVGWVHVFHEYTTPGRRSEPPYVVATVRGAGSNQLHGRTNVHDQLAWNLTLTQAWGAWSPGVSFGMFHHWPYAASGPAVGVGALPDDDVVRTYSDFAAWLDVSPSAWFTVEAGYSLTRSVLDADGTYGNPLFSRHQDWRVYLFVNVVLDRLADAFDGRARPERGIVRW